MTREETLNLLPGKNCGRCGAPTCEAFAGLVASGEADLARCIHVKRESKCVDCRTAVYNPQDVVGQDYDFILLPLRDEVSCREILVPFNPALIRELDVKKGDIIIGRPMGQGCPVQHVMEVISADRFGVITAWIVGPAFSRGREVKEVGPYNIIGFEGLTQTTSRAPAYGRRQPFLPGYCMMNLVHTGVVNFINETSAGTVIRVEDIIIGV